uniref:Ig-like domain-containing protein n=1 Tax=Callorhinchus milii TaxID=7868 RepID=A0A4W3HDC6_CALMI
MASLTCWTVTDRDFSLKGSADPLLIQSPTLERVTEGHPARLQCSMENANVSRTDVHWYRQLPGQQREWILTHDTNGRKTDHEDVNQRLQPSRVTSNNTYILILRRVIVSDAAVYLFIAPKHGRDSE